MITIDERRVEQLTRTIGALRLVPNFAEQIAPRVDASREAQLRATLWAAAICHSTKGGLQGFFNGQPYNGWDYLLQAFLLLAEHDETLVAPERIGRMTAPDLHLVLTERAESTAVSLRDLPRRAEMLREGAATLSSAYGGLVGTLLQWAGNRVGGKGGAYERLAELEAFRDPLQKKSSAFLMTVYFARLWTIDDLEQVIPMIDYHRIRLLCRTGCIQVEDAELRRALLNREEVDAKVGEALRDMAAEICQTIARTSSIPIFDFDVLMWAHARSCCRHRPVCAGGTPENRSFYDLVEEPFVGRCVFQGWCPGAVDVEFRGLWEPTVATELY